MRSPALSRAVSVRVLTLAFLASGAWVGLAVEKPAKRVFAHYMVALPTAGGGATLEDYQQEIREAQQRGLDGFALNCGGWSVREPHYKARTLLLYEAAKQLGTGFQLFLSADYCCGLSFEETEDMIETFRDHPNQLRWEGKPVLSTFSGQGKNNEHGRQLLAFLTSLDKPVVFVPYFYPQPNVSELPQQSHVDQVLRDFPGLDGFFYFGAAGNGEQLAACNERLARTWVGAGKIFMAGNTPFYRGNGGNFRVFETRGFEGMARQWEAAIRNDATWVEIVTWNDWGESSYVAPFGPPQATALWKGHFGPKLLSHAAYLDASRYYIDWFKHGTPPPIRKDALYYFYRLHPAALPATVAAKDDAAGVDVPRGAHALRDSVFVTLFLTRPATLTVQTGDKTQRFEAAAGVQHFETPFGFGSPRFVLQREGCTLLDKTGEHEITATDSASRFNYFAGSAVVP